MSRWIGAFVASLVLAACGGSDESEPEAFATLEPDPGFPGTPGDPAVFTSYFEYEPLSGCAVSNPTDLGAATELRVFRGPGVDDAEVRRFLGGLQRYYDQYGVAMSMRHAVIEVPFVEALILDLGVLSVRVRAETNVDLNGPVGSDDEERVTASLGRAVFHNVREIIRVYATPRRDVVDVVLLPEMVTRNLPPELERFRGLAGLGVSPELLAQVTADDPAASLYEWLGVTDAFTPLAIVGVNPVETFLDEPDVIVAHEVGHAYGLVHVEAAGNLLNQGEIDCDLELDDAQLDVVRQATTAVAHTTGLERVSLTSRAAEFAEALRGLARRPGR